MTHSILDLLPEKRAEVEKRFWAKVEKTERCWNWYASKDKDGYGIFGVNSHLVLLAHRVSYELSKGRIPNGLEPDHICRNSSCVNPNHLEAVTHKENMLRGNGWAGRNIRKTHCPKGHPLIEGNLVVHRLKDGHRECRVCHSERTKRWIKTHRMKIKKGLISSK